MKSTIYQYLPIGLLAAIANLLFSFAATALVVNDETVLVSTPKVTVTKWDLDAELLKFPAEDYYGIIANKSRLAQIVENIMVTKTLALDGEAKGLEKDKTVQQQIAVARNKILATQFMAKHQEQMPKADYTPRARELYLVNKSQYMTTPEIETAHVLIDLKTRTEAEAQKLINDIREQIKKGAKFVDMVKQYSDDKVSAGNDGVVALGPVSNLDENYFAAAMKLKIGEISAPVKSQFGFHLIRLDKLVPARQITFDELKDQLVAQQKEGAEKNYYDSYVNAIKTDPAIVVHTEAMDAVRPDVSSLLKNAIPTNPKAEAKVETKVENRTETKAPTKPTTKASVGNNKK